MTDQQIDLRRNSFEVEELNRVVHRFSSFYAAGDWKKTVLLMSDLHWDNPKAKHDLIIRHLEQAKEKNAKVILNGDTFCLMQGKWDPRGSKSDIRPEHNTKDYLDAIVNTAVDFFGPYKDIIALIGRGNHEQSVLKRHETDILNRFVDLFNRTHRPEQTVKIGGYGGWVPFSFDREKSHDPKTIKMKYYHGSGGGGIVTKGMITNQRRQAGTSGADIIWSGHVHEDVTATFVTETLNASFNVEFKETQHIITSTYKEEYGDGHGGWHVERGAPPKPLGGAWLDFYHDRGEIKFDTYRAK